jgi:hypothetical protein
LSDFGSTSKPPLGLSPRSRLLTPKVVALLIAVPLAAIIIWAGTRPNAMKRAASIGSAVRNPSSLLADASKPKPAPGKPLVPAEAPAPLPPLPDWSHTSASNPQPATAPPPVMPNGMTNTVVPAPIPGIASPSATVTVRAPFPPVAYNARHDKAFGGSCGGQLTLSNTGLNFVCNDDQHGNLQIAVSEINSVDENGVRLNSGKKFHFTVSGMNKPSEQQLFADWLNRVR